MVGKITVLLLVATVLCSEVRGYTYRGEINTDSGVCDLTRQGFGKVRVNEDGYSNTKCEKVECRIGTFEAYGCGTQLYDKEKCREVRGTGNYPNCCPKVVCGKNK